MVKRSLLDAFIENLRISRERDPLFSRAALVVR
jgi:hypothetical protein